jgi:nitrogen fixation protein FixH
MPLKQAVKSSFQIPVWLYMVIFFTTLIEVYLILEHKAVSHSWSRRYFHCLPLEN